MLMKWRKKKSQPERIQLKRKSWCVVIIWISFSKGMQQVRNANISPAATTYSSERPAFRSDKCEWIARASMIQKKKKHIRLPQYRQILQEDQIILTGGVGWFYWEGPQSATITHNNCCLHAHFTTNGTNKGRNNSMWPCRAVHPWSAFWLKGEEVWFVTTIL